MMKTAIFMMLMDQENSKIVINILIQKKKKAKAKRI